MEAVLDHHTRTSSSDDCESSFDSEVDNDIEEFRLKARNRRRQSSDVIVPSLTKTDNVDVDSSENNAYLDKLKGTIEDLNFQKLLNSVPYDVNTNGSIPYDAKTNGETGTKTTINGTEPEQIEQNEEEIITEEEEVVELEFENAIPKLHTHTMHCPNCNHHITKVVLRRTIIKRRPPVVEKRHNSPVDLLGCFSCFSLFTSSDSGGFNPFPIFRRKPTTSVVPGADGNDVVKEDENCFSIFRVFPRKKDSKQLKPMEVKQQFEDPKSGKADQDSEKPKLEKVDQDSEKPKLGKVDQDFGKTDHSSPPVKTINTIVNKPPIPQENCFGIFRVFHREKDSKQLKPPEVKQDFEDPKSGKVDQYSEKPKPGNVEEDPKRQKLGKVDQDFGKIDHPSPPIKTIDTIVNKLPIPQGENYERIVENEPITKPENQSPVDSVPSHYDQLHSSVKLPTTDESRIDISPAITSQTQVPTRGSTRQDSTSYEILKSIVYGGLMEVIASLSIVTSAAAGDATTLNIIALALANLVGGVFIIGHNIWDLKEDCYKFYTQETSTEESRSKYKELLGSVEHFPMHAFFTILSFLVFGIIPPVAYGYSFHETNDRDFTMVIVAVASLVCVGLLAISKAYINRCTGFLGYIKTIMYYLTTAVTSSSVSYVVGNLVARLIEELGWFETGSDVAMVVLPEVVSTNPALAY